MLRQYKESQNESEVLMSALMAMREKNAHLENNLSAETRLKMDLFSALGDAKRQIEIQRSKHRYQFYFHTFLWSPYIPIDLVSTILLIDLFVSIAQPKTKHNRF